MENTSPTVIACHGYMQKHKQDKAEWTLVEALDTHDAAYLTNLINGAPSCDAGVIVRLRDGSMEPTFSLRYIDVMYPVGLISELLASGIIEVEIYKAEKRNGGIGNVVDLDLLIVTSNSYYDLSTDIPPSSPFVQHRTRYTRR